MLVCNGGGLKVVGGGLRAQNAEPKISDHSLPPVSDNDKWSPVEWMGKFFITH